MISRILGAIAVMAGAITIPASAAERRPVDLYVLSGQSNMQGIGTLADLATEDRVPLPNAFFWTGKGFVPLVPGTTQTSTRAGEFGPEITFAKTMAARFPERDVYIVKYSASGQPLHHGWDGAKWLGGPPAPGRTTFYPGDSPDDPNIGKLYRNQRAITDAAVAHLKAHGADFSVRGFLWMQGEADAKNEVSAREYAAGLRRLKRRVEQDLGVKSLPMVFGQVLPHEPAMARFTHRAEIRDSMRKADEASGAPESIPGVRMVSTDGFPLKPDTVHYDAAGQAALGRAMAEAMIALLNGDRK